MNLWFVDRAGDNLHGLWVRAVAPDIFQIGSSRHNHLVPCKRKFRASGGGKMTVGVDHHIGDAALGCGIFPLSNSIRNAAEWMNAGSPGRGSRLRSPMSYEPHHSSDRSRQDGLILIADMFITALQDAGLTQESAFRFLKRSFVVGELRAGLLVASSRCEL